MIMKQFSHCLFTLTVLIILALTACQQQTQSVDSDEFDEDMAYVVRIAETLFQTLKDQGYDMDKGPCLSEDLMEDWVIDVAHNPRDTKIDDDPANQCQTYLDGTAHHFVELDMKGKLIRAK
jgi:hypothetical protein